MYFEIQPKICLSTADIGSVTNIAVIAQNGSNVQVEINKVGQRLNGLIPLTTDYQTDERRKKNSIYHQKENP
jgi:hypothetical protein